NLRRLQLHVGHGSWTGTGGMEESGFIVVVVNRGRCPLILQGVGIYGAACLGKPVEEMRIALAHRRTLPRKVRRAMDRDFSSPSGHGEPIIIAPYDAYEAHLPCHVTS